MTFDDIVTARSISSVVVAAIVIGLMPSSATALTAELVKKCDAAAYKAFPNQRVGTNLGIEQRSKFRQDCIAKNGDLSSLPAPTADAPPPPAKSKAK